MKVPSFLQKKKLLCLHLHPGFVFLIYVSTIGYVPRIFVAKKKCTSFISTEIYACQAILLDP
jgi:hypothetical protein